LSPSQRLRGEHPILSSLVKGDTSTVEQPAGHPTKRKARAMLSLALTFLVIALIAGLLGFGLVGGMAYGAAKIFFFIFLVLAVVSLLAGRRPVA
jgi:uncharacterized membrane protein YtjA (UPF0391 family)